MSNHVRGVRGAITVAANTPEAIAEATHALLTEMVRRNGIERAALASAFFSATPDVNAAFPAASARALGWDDVPLLCFQEMDVPGALPMCLRVLLHWNTDTPISHVRHCYLRGAAALRPDLASAD